MAENIPRSHPRYNSLMTREKMKDAMKEGLVHETGLIAHGRGEAFDYLIGEKTIQIADKAEKTAAALLLLADKPVISVNGNVVVLAAKEIIDLSTLIPAKIEVNLFHRSEERVNKLINLLKKQGAIDVYGKSADAKIPHLDHDRGLCDYDGIYTSDVILVPLEDGDRCEALKKMDKKVIAIDLNPISRTSKAADISIVDDVKRALSNIYVWSTKLKNKTKEELRDIVESYNNNLTLQEVLSYIAKRINHMF